MPSNLPRAARSTTPSTARRQELQAWAAEILAEMQNQGITPSQLAPRLGFSRPALVSWLNASCAPSPWALSAIAETLGVSLRSQMTKLGWIPEDGWNIDDRPSSGVLRSDLDREFRQITQNLGQLANRVEALSSTATAITRAVIEPPRELPALWRTRWQAMLSPRPTGTKYPTSYGLAVEFSLRRNEREMSRNTLLRLLGSNPAMKRYLDSPAARQLAADGHADDTTSFRAQRLELLALMSDEPGALYGDWLGDHGTFWKALSFQADPGPHTHMYLPGDEQLSISQATRPVVLSTLEGVTSGRTRRIIDNVLVVSFTYFSAHRIARIIAEALGWAFRNTTQDATRERGFSLGDSWRGDRVTQMIADSATRDVIDSQRRSIPNTIISLSGTDAAISESLLRTLKGQQAPHVLYVRPSIEMMESWERHAYDGRSFGQDTAPTYHARPAAEHACRQIEHVLMTRPTGSFTALKLRPKRHIYPSDTTFEDPTLSDWWLRAAWRFIRSFQIGGLVSPASLLGQHSDALEQEVRNNAGQLDPLNHKDLRLGDVRWGA